MSGRYTALLIALLLLITLPYWMTGVYYVNVASQILFYAIFALGLNVLAGYGGLVSLGHAGLFGVTAYATGYMLQLGFSHTTAIIFALVTGVAAMAVYAALSLRSTGIGFIMITLALGEILWGLAYRWISLTGGDNGLSLKTRPEPLGFSLANADTFYYATLIVFLLSLAAMMVFVRSPLGAALMGTRRISSKRAHAARETFARLSAEYPDAHCELDHHNPFELLAATILSAQCTDKRVNLVTPVLFAR